MFGHSGETCWRRFLYHGHFPAQSGALCRKKCRYGDCVWGSPYRKECIGSCRFPVGQSFAEDAYFNVLIKSAPKEPKFAWVKLPLYFYRQRSDSLFHIATLETQLATMKWWLPQLAEFDKTQFALQYIAMQLYNHRITAMHCSNPQVARKNAHRVIRSILPYFGSCFYLSKKQWIVLPLATALPSFYHWLLSKRDPGFRIYRNSTKERYKNYVLKEWD